VGAPVDGAAAAGDGNQRLDAGGGGRQGLARDESQYFRAGERYWGWFEALGDAVRAGKPGQAFSRNVVDSFWGDNHEHPP